MEAQKTDIKQVAKTQNKKQVDPQHFYLLTTSSKLPKTVSSEIFAKFRKST